MLNHLSIPFPFLHVPYSAIKQRHKEALVERA